MTQEYWLPIVGHEERYEVSDQGRVRTIERMVPCGLGRFRSVKSRILKLSSTGRGYLNVGIRGKDYERCGLMVHQMVAQAFIGPCPEGMQILHGINGISDNSLSNLSYGTPKENAADRLRDGTETRGSRNGMARLREETVLLIREQASTKSSRELAILHDVSPTTIADVVTRRTWAHLD
jgi:hypothetical protein